MIHKMKFTIFTTIAMLTVLLYFTSYDTEAIIASSSSNVADINTSYMVEYTIPITMTGGINGEPRNIIMQSAGHSWFTLPASNQIGELIVTSTVDYQFHMYDIPTPNSEPHDLIYDGDSIWFTAKAVNQIGQLDIVSNTIITHSIPTANSMPTGIAQAPDGRVWFVNSASNKLASFATDTPEIITEYPITCTSGIPANLNDIAIEESDSIWLTAPACNRVFEFNSITETIASTPVGIFGESFSPGNITLGRNNEPWITAPNKDIFGLRFPGTLTYWRWRNIISEQAGLSDITFSTFNDIDHIWVAEADTNRIGLLLTTPSGGDISFREASLPTIGSNPHSIAVDDANHAWITASGVNKIVEWSPPYFFSTYLPLILR